MFDTIEKLQEALIELGGERKQRCGWRETGYVDGQIVDEEIETGGVSGGSCWGTETERYTTSESFGKTSILDKFLEQYYPDISFLRYRRLRRDVITEETYSINQYYGNHTDYNQRIIDVAALLDHLRS